MGSGTESRKLKMQLLFKDCKRRKSALEAAQHLPQERGLSVGWRLFVERQLFGTQDEGQRNPSPGDPLV